MEEIFTKIYETNYWAGRQSRSGSGSDLEETVRIRHILPGLFKSLSIESILDIPCGDMNWMAATVMPNPFKYIGADIVPKIIDLNRKKYDLSDVEFMVLDITKDELPQVDMIFTRDCLGHLSDENVAKAVENIKRANPKYFVATHWPTVDKKDIEDGGFRPINMHNYLDEDFVFVDLIKEDIEGKYLGVWAYEPSR